MRAGVAIRDLTGSLYRMPLAFSLALDDIHGKYRRTVLGPLWIAIAYGATIAGFVLVFSGLFGVNPQTYALYLAAGFSVWSLISQFLSDMPNTFVQARGLIESYQMPWLTHIWRRSIGYAIVFLHHLVTLFIIMALLGAPPRSEMLYAVPALLIVMVAGTGIGMVLAVFGARYRDLQPAMTVITSFLFMFSPVMWRPEQLQVNEWVVRFNPLHYVVNILRQPLLGVVPTPAEWIGTSIGATVVFIVGFTVFFLCRRRLYHWL